MQMHANAHKCIVSMSMNMNMNMGMSMNMRNTSFSTSILVSSNIQVCLLWDAIKQVQT